mmetsp:Transcript_27883/g.28154  ORF Transcript_27883/g.28154 Transcript_27883/m.28154 type:complete len:156 (+) Transcript_27883:109-576(+)
MAEFPASIMNLRLKIGELERQCTARPTDTISRIKQCQFPAESVRFIYQGRELDDRKSLLELEIRDNSVFHVVLRSERANSRTSDDQTSRGLFPEPDIDPCSVLAIFLGLTIILGLMLAISVPELLTPLSWIILMTYSLGGFSFIYVICKNRLAVS